MISQSTTLSRVLDFMISYKGRAVVILLLRITIGGIFVIAAIPKLLNPLIFAHLLSAYHVLPTNMLLFFAWLIPLTEFVFGMMLITGFCLKIGFTGASILLLIFIAAITQVMFRGLNIECGCFGEHDPAGLGIIIRDFCVLVVLFMCCRYSDYR